MICGRRTHDSSLPLVGVGRADWRSQASAVCGHPLCPEDVPDGHVYTFVTDGIESALRQAKVTAGNLDVAIMGGPDPGRQYQEAGLVDEVGVHLVPVLFGSGIRMFDWISTAHIRLEPIDTIASSDATHLRYRARKH